MSSSGCILEFMYWDRGAVNLCPVFALYAVEPLL